MFPSKNKKNSRTKKWLLFSTQHRKGGSGKSKRGTKRPMLQTASDPLPKRYHDYSSSQTANDATNAQMQSEKEPASVTPIPDLYELNLFSEMVHSGMLDTKDFVNLKKATTDRAIEDMFTTEIEPMILDKLETYLSLFLSELNGKLIMWPHVHTFENLCTYFISSGKQFSVFNDKTLRPALQLVALNLLIPRDIQALAKQVFGQIEAWDVSTVTNMEGVFRNATGGQLIDFSHWNVSNVTNMKEMFCDCKIYIDGLSKWNVSKVTNMQGMFEKCTTLFQQPLNWDVSNVTNMDRMFLHLWTFKTPIFI